MSLLSVSFSGIDKALSRRVTYEASVCSLVLDVHVKQHEMHMSCCPTCTCRTALHVHLKQSYTPRLYTLLYERGLYQYRRKRRMAMTNIIKLKNRIYLRLDELRCTIGITLSLTALKQAFKRELLQSYIVIRLIVNKFSFELNGVCHCHPSLSPVSIKLYLVE